MKAQSRNIVFLYVTISTIWMLVSNYVVEVISFVTDINSHLLQMGKGLFFIITTGILLYVLIKNQQKTLVNYGNQYKNLFHSNPNPLWIYDYKTLKFLEVNDTAMRIYGYSRDEFRKMTILDIRPQKDVQRVQEAVRKVPDHYYNSGVYQHIKKNGKELTVSITGNRIRFNKRDCVLIMAQDITVRLQLDKRLKLSYKVERELKEELERNLILLSQSLEESKQREYQINEQNKILRRHSWTNSHAIRKPLASILSLVSLSKDTDQIEELKEFHSLIEISSQSLDKIIKEIGKEINNYENDGESKASEHQL